MLASISQKIEVQEVSDTALGSIVFTFGYLAIGQKKSRKKWAKCTQVRLLRWGIFVGLDDLAGEPASGLMESMDHMFKKGYYCEYSLG